MLLCPVFTSVFLFRMKINTTKDVKKVLKNLTLILQLLYICFINITTMKAQFEIKNWLSENRETVIAKYNELTGEKFFSGISLKDFMVQVLNAMTRNNIRSEKRAVSMLHFLMSDIYFNNSTTTGNNNEVDNSMISENSKGQLPSSIR